MPCSIAVWTLAGVIRSGEKNANQPLAEADKITAAMAAFARLLDLILLIGIFITFQIVLSDEAGNEGSGDREEGQHGKQALRDWEKAVEQRKSGLNAGQRTGKQHQAH